MSVIAFVRLSFVTTAQLHVLTGRVEHHVERTECSVSRSYLSMRQNMAIDKSILNIALALLIKEPLGGLMEQASEPRISLGTVFILNNLFSK